MKQAYDETIKVGDRVRSFDFEGCDDCYIDGVVESIGDKLEGCPRYKIRVQTLVFGGEVQTDHVPPYVYPPVNGTETWLGGVTAGVVKLPVPGDSFFSV